MSALLGVVALSAAGCTKPSIATSSTNNPEIRLELLFEHDGVKVYRFEDRGRPVYYTDARGRMRWSEYHSTGKGSGYLIDRSVETVQPDR